MTTSATALDLIEAFRRSKTMFAAVELGIFDGKRPADYKRIAHLLEKQQERLNALESGSRNHDGQATFGAVLDLIEAFRRLKTASAAVEPGVFDGRHPADDNELPRLLNAAMRRSLEPKGYDHFRNCS